MQQQSADLASSSPGIAEIEARAERAGVRTCVVIGIGVVIVCTIIGIILYGWELAGISAIGLSLYAIIFGLPFWLATIDAQVEHARSSGGAAH